MKTLFLYKSTINADSEQRTMCIGLMWLTAYLKEKGFNTSAHNLSNTDWDYAKDLITKGKPDIVGISCLSFNRKISIELAKLVKSINKDAVVIFGGPHATLIGEQMLKNYPEIDYILKGEGEKVMENFINCLKENKDVKEVKGLLLRDGDDIVYTGQQEIIENLDELPSPAKYFRYNQITTTRGCPANCIFCATPRLSGRKVRFRSAKHIVDEIEILHKKHKFSYFFLSDDTFNIKPQHIIGICKEILERKLEIIWNCMLRVDTINKEMFEWMKKAGCVSVFFGVESGSPKILKILNKGTTVEQIKQACKLAREFGFEIQTYFIIGSPGETKETIEETKKLLDEIKPMSATTSLMTLYPGSALYEDAKKQGFIDDDYWLTDKDEKIYTAEHSIEALKKFERAIAKHFAENKTNYSYSAREISENIKKFSSPMEYHYLGLALQRRGEQKKAIIAFSIAVTKNPGFVPGYINMGLIAMQQKKFAEAARLFESALQIDPFETKTYTYLGDSYLRIGKVKEAIQIFEIASHRDSNNTSMLNRLGSAYGIENQFEKSLEVFEKILEINPNDTAAKRNIEFTKLRMKADK
ncbi:MAG: radical SAM protein [Nanoarchaeota archaeon]|nr:radical SAM protein [Nanoarchaeota archaeon]